MRAFRKAVTAGVRRYLFEESVQTDDRGIYRFSGLVPGEYLVAVSSVQVAAPISIIRELQPGALPRPIGSARGGLFPQPPGSPGAIQVGDSTFAIGPGIPTPIPKSDSLWVYPRTFYPFTLRAQQSLSIVIGSGDDRSGVDLQLAAVPTVRISGTVSPPPPAPLVLALVQPDDVSVVHDEPWLAAFTDANGAFTFPAVPSGQYFVRTRSVDASWADVPLAVDTDHVDGVVVALERGLHISGRLVFEGSQTTPPEAAVKNLAILIQSTEPQLGGTPPPARTDVSGKFTSLAVQGGRYFISIGASPEGWMFKSATYDGRDLSETPIDLRADISGVVITFTDRWTGLSGVVHSAQGAPDPDACVLIFPTDSQKWMGYGRQARRLRSVRPDRSGAFGISSLPPDDYFVVAIPDEQSADWRDPKFLESLARIASVVSIGDGEHRTQNLRTLEVR
jgi:hypothetical protein